MMQVIALLPLLLVAASSGYGSQSKTTINISQAEVAPFSVPDSIASSSVNKNETNDAAKQSLVHVSNVTDASRIVEHASNTSLNTTNDRPPHWDSDDEIDLLIQDAIRAALGLHSDGDHVENAVGLVKACAGEELLASLAECVFEDLQASSADKGHKVGSVIDWCMFPDQIRRLGVCVRNGREGVRLNALHPTSVKTTSKPLSADKAGPLTLYEVMEERALVPILNSEPAVPGAGKRLVTGERATVMMYKRTDRIKHPLYRVSRSVEK